MTEIMPTRDLDAVLSILVFEDSGSPPRCQLAALHLKQRGFRHGPQERAS